MQISVQAVTPASPKRTYTEQPLQIQLAITNHTTAALPKLRVLAERGYPISTPGALAKSMAHPAPPGGGGIPIPATPKTAKSSFSIAPGATADVTFQTTTTIASGPGSRGICLCGNQVYPIFLVVHSIGEDGSDTVVGTTATYLPVFYQAPKRLRVGWIWPIIDRPHRFTSDKAFTDDDLAASVADGGRLDRLLSVLEGLPDTTSITMLLDPETIDEIQVMTGPYRVTSGKTSTPGTGQAVAAGWLSRLRAALATHPNYRVDLTPYADPDVESLSERGYGWHTALPVAMATRVSTALGPIQTHSDLAWPAAPRISTRTLQELGRSGVSSVVLNTDNVRTPTKANDHVSGTARLRADDSSITGLLIDPQLAGDVSRSLAVGGSGAAALPSVMSDLAVRVISEPTAPHAVVLTPPRNVDPSVPDAVATITTTTRSPFTSAISLPEVASRFLPDGRSSLRSPSGSATGLPGTLLNDIEDVRTAEPAVTSLLTCPVPTRATCQASAKLLRSIPITVQRTESSAWRRDRLTEVNAGQAGAKQLADLVKFLVNGVQIVAPSSGMYTLASDNASLPVTVKNNLDYQVNVKVRVSTLGGVPGFAASDVKSRVVPAGVKQTIELPASVQRSGRFRVQAELTTASGIALGQPVFLTVHSTALGLVGVIITIVAGVLLVLALLFRALRAVGRKRQKRRVRSSPTIGTVA